MTNVAFVVRCQRCGVARKSYNDPTRGISVIECKRPCGNSHYDWTLLRTIPATEEWPPAAPAESDIPLYIPLTHVPVPFEERDGSPAPTRTAAVSGEKVQFRSKGKGSLVRSRSTSAAVEGAMTVREGGKGATTKFGVDARDASAGGKREKDDCFVQ